MASPALTHPVTRHFVTVGSRQGHYRRAGSGPPVVLLHTAPMSSRINVELMELLADRCTVLAFDRAGFGLSDRLEAEVPEIADYADGLIAVLDELGIASAVFVGHSTGTLVALEVARRDPTRVQGLVLENMPFLQEQEAPDFLENFGFGIEPRYDGGHLAQAWSATRDVYGHWPWYRPSVATWRNLDRPPPAALQQTVLDLMFAEPNGHLAYDAVWRYRGAVEAVLALAQPTVLVGREDAALFTHLERLSGLRESCRIVRLPRPGGPVWPSAWWWSPQVARLVDQLGPRGEASPPVEARPIPGRVARAYVAAGGGQVLVRRVVDRPGRPLVLVPDAPFSGRALEARLLAEGALRPAYALDPPGVGDSDPLAGGAPELEALALALIAALDRLGLAEVDLAGSGAGAVLAAAVAVLAPQRVASLLLEDVPLPSEHDRAELAERYTVDLVPRWDGTQLLTAWQRAYDGALFRPWFRTSRAAYLALDPPPPGDLHLATLDLLRAPGCQLVALAALCHPLRPLLARLRVPTEVRPGPGPEAAAVAAEAAALVALPPA